MDVDSLCQEVHDRYELAAKENGWKTADLCRTTWDKLPEANKKTMRVALRPIAEELTNLRHALGMLTTLNPYMDIDVTDPIGMAEEIIKYLNDRYINPPPPTLPAQDRFVVETTTTAINMMRNG